MSEYNVDIADMQCWVFRMAQTRWKMPAKDCAELFKKYNILGFIADCYDILHLNSYECVLNDAETLLKNRGVTAMATSNYDNTINYKATDSQKECCAVIVMREAIETLAVREKISYEEALLRFTSSRVYEALFDFDTEIWKEGSDYLLNLYDYCNSKKTA